MTGRAGQKGVLYATSRRSFLYWCDTSSLLRPTLVLHKCYCCVLSNYETNIIPNNCCPKMSSTMTFHLLYLINSSVPLFCHHMNWISLFHNNENCLIPLLRDTEFKQCRWILRRERSTGTAKNNRHIHFSSLTLRHERHKVTLHNPKLPNHSKPNTTQP
jgi:hypothetical protein